MSARQVARFLHALTEQHPPPELRRAEWDEQNHVTFTLKTWDRTGRHPVEIDGRRYRITVEEIP